MKHIILANPARPANHGIPAATGVKRLVFDLTQK